MSALTPNSVFRNYVVDGVSASGANQPSKAEIRELLNKGLMQNVWQYGALGDGSTNDAAAISAGITAVNGQGGGSLFFPPGNYVDNGTRTLSPKVNLIGLGMGASIVTSTATTGAQFNMPSANEVDVEYGGNFIHGLTFTGAGTGTTASCFKVKNKVNLRWDHCEIGGYKYLIEGVRANTANSVNNIAFTGVRFGACQTAIYAARQWNGFHVDRTCGFSSFEDWAVIAYDCDGITINGVFDGDPSVTGAGHVVLGGCSGIDMSSYHEGDPDADHFIRIASAKDKDGNAALGGVNIDTSRGGVLTGVRGSSGGGTAYVLELDGAIGIVSLGCRAGSGIGTAYARLTTGTRGNTFIGCYPASGTVASYQTAADEGYNPCQDLNGGMLSQVRSYTVSTLPSATAPGQIIYVSNETSGQTLAFSNGSAWLRVQDRATVS